MAQAQQECATPTGAITREAVNQRLRQSGFQPLTEAGYRGFSGVAPVYQRQFLSAVAQSGDNTRARGYAERFLARIEEKAAEGRKVEGEQYRDRQAAQGARSGTPREQRPEYLSHHCYGGKAALCVQADETRGSKPRQTVRIEAAVATAPRSYNWTDKVAIQLTRQELLQVAAVLMGLQPGVSYQNHGENNDKGFEVKNQKGGIFVRVFAKDKGVRAVPVTAEDAAEVQAIIFRAILKNWPWLTDLGVRAMIADMVKRQDGRFAGG